MGKGGCLAPALLPMCGAAAAAPPLTPAWLTFMKCGTNPSTRYKPSMASQSAIAEESDVAVESAFRSYTSSTKLNRKGTGVAIMWFRNDLRIIDNEALFRAWNSCEALLPVYCLDPRIFGTTYYFRFPRTGELRVQFILESLADLRSNLQQRGLNLLIETGKPENVLPTLASIVDAHTVFAHKEICSEEILVEKLVRRGLERATVSAASNSDGSQGLRNSYTRLELIWGSTMYHLNDLPFTSSNVPDVFTAFRKAAESRCKVRPCIKMPASFAPSPTKVTVGSIDWGHIPTLNELGLKAQDKCALGGLQFFGGEKAALSRIHDYFWEKDKLRIYKETRNGMLGADYSTKLSPWLSLGCISPRYIYEEVKRYEQDRVANVSTYWVLFELMWRDYFRFISIKYGNAIFHLEGPRRVKGIKWSQDQALFECWKSGRTGYPLVDANMKELMATGFMSNRGRQIVCSFLVRDMGLDWRMGAEWFESCLLDYDPCSNYGNWTYGAGVGNDPREDRYFSIAKQAQSYDPDGEYVAHWIPELAKLKTSERHFPGSAYIKPVVPLKFPSTGRGHTFQSTRPVAGKQDFKFNDKSRRA